MVYTGLLHSTLVGARHSIMYLSYLVYTEVPVNFSFVNNGATNIFYKPKGKEVIANIFFFFGGGTSTSILHLPLCIHGSISVQYKLILWEVLIKRGNSSLLVHSLKPAVVTGLKPRTRTHPGLPHGWQKPASWSSSLPLRICISEKAGLCSQISHSGNLMWGMGTPTYPTILYRSVTEVLCSRY